MMTLSRRDTVDRCDIDRLNLNKLAIQGDLPHITCGRRGVLLCEAKWPSGLFQPTFHRPFSPSAATALRAAAARMFYPTLRSLSPVPSAPGRRVPADLSLRRLGASYEFHHRRLRRV